MFIYRTSLILAGLTLFTCTAYAQAPTPTSSVKAISQDGWLEGTVTTPQGHPVSEANTAIGKQIVLVRRGGGTYTLLSDPTLGGFYSNHQIKPGIYDVSVTTGYWGNTGSQPYRPQRILGVVIKPGQKTLLNIVMPEGDVLQQTGQNAILSAAAETGEIAQMQKQLDGLKAQVASLLKAMPAAPAASAKP